MRIVTTFALAAVAAGLSMTRAPAMAQESTPAAQAIRTCVGAYETAKKLGLQEENLLKFTNNSSEVARQFTQRADKLAEKANTAGMKKGLEDPAFYGRLDSAALSEELSMEGIFASSNAILAPGDVFNRQRQLLAQVRKCDQDNGFAPALDEPQPAAEIVAYYKTRAGKQVDEKNARLAALDNFACASRFYVFAVSNPAMAAEMQQKTIAVMEKMQAAKPGSTPDIIGLEVQRGAEAIGSKMKTAEDFEVFLEEINECERRNSMSITKKQ